MSPVRYGRDSPYDWKVDCEMRGSFFIENMVLKIGYYLYAKKIAIKKGLAEWRNK